MSDHPEVFRGSGNVFADLGFPNAEEHLLKAEIVTTLGVLIKQQQLDLGEAAARIQLSEAELAAMLKGRFREFTVERLLRFVNALGNDVQIVISKEKTSREKASLSVVTV
jgi:predicted XRE-type DNA-binding protein